MLKNRIIPCLDVKNGRVVKGINFVDPEFSAIETRYGSGYRWNVS